MKTTVSTQPLTTRSNISDISLLRVNVSQENVFSQLTENDLSIVNVPLRRVIESYRWKTSLKLYRSVLDWITCIEDLTQTLKGKMPSFWIVRLAISVSIATNVQDCLVSQTIQGTCDNWDTDYNSYNWEPELMTIFITWQSRVTVDSIRNSCDVLWQSQKIFNQKQKFVQFLDIEQGVLCAA